VLGPAFDPSTTKKNNGEERWLEINLLRSRMLILIFFFSQFFNKQYCFEKFEKGKLKRGG
jgi:hypothetical protein